MSAIPSSKIGNFIVHVIRSKQGGEAVAADIITAVIALEEALSKHKDITPQQWSYVMQCFGTYLKGVKKWTEQ
jgi:hypothetical protein